MALNRGSTFLSQFISQQRAVEKTTPFGGETTASQRFKAGHNVNTQDRVEKSKIKASLEDYQLDASFEETLRQFKESHFPAPESRYFIDRVRDKTRVARLLEEKQQEMSQLQEKFISEKRQFGKHKEKIMRIVQKQTLFEYLGDQHLFEMSYREYVESSREVESTARRHLHEDSRVNRVIDLTSWNQESELILILLDRLDILSDENIQRLLPFPTDDCKEYLNSNFKKLVIKLTYSASQYYKNKSLLYRQENLALIDLFRKFFKMNLPESEEEEETAHFEVRAEPILWGLEWKKEQLQGDS